MKNVKSITVAGGGTAGLISAMILKARLNVNVRVVCSSEIGIIGVGEGSTEHFSEFIKFLGISPIDIIKECGATFKVGVYFKDWTNTDYLHSVHSSYSSTLGQYHNIYAHQIINNKNLYPVKIEENLISDQDIYNFANSPTINQFHFDTFKLNIFLTKVAKNLGIEIIDDEIIDVVLNEEGFINEIVGKKQKYKDDFYIDATGFKRVLMNKLENKWISFGKYLKMKSAITFPTINLKNEKNYDMWTLSSAMDAGWRFKIPLCDRSGNGYIYDSDFINADQAKREVEKKLGYEIDVKKEFNFDPGMLENIWKKNCVAIGLSGSFFEPLEATSIGLTIQQSFLLMHKIPNYNDKTIKEYNDSFEKIINNIRDFIVLHYLTKKNNTDFWKSIYKLEIPESLQNNLEKWKNKLPIYEDFVNDSSYSMFRSANFTLVLNGINFFNKEEILKEYNMITNQSKIYTSALIDSVNISEQNAKYVKHKDAIFYMQNNFNSIIESA
jgi:tryptophan halogenase